MDPGWDPGMEKRHEGKTEEAGIKVILVNNSVLMFGSLVTTVLY